MVDKLIKRTAAVIACTTLFLPGVTGAVIQTTGAVQLTAPLSDVRPDQTENNQTIWLFPEKTGYVLTTPVTVNITAPGSYSSYPPSPVTTLPAGTKVDVYFMHFDPGPLVRLQGSVTFDSPILGVIVRDTQLLASNFLGAPTTTYPNSGTKLGLENGDDKVHLSGDMKTLSVDWLANFPGDRIRIITASAIPEPTSLLLFAVGIAGAGALLRRKG